MVGVYYRGLHRSHSATSPRTYHASRQRRLRSGLSASAMTSSFVFRHTPLKVVYLLSTVGTLLVKLPGWMVLLTFPSARQKVSWSYKRALLISIFQHISSALNK